MALQRTLIAGALAGLALVWELGEAEACSCVPSPGVREELAASGSVFEGRVLSLKHEPKVHRITAKLEVLRRFKGKDAKRVDVVTVDEGSLCGFHFEKGKSYLLFTHESEGTLSVSLCSRSKASAEAAEDFATLAAAAQGGGATTPDAAASAPPPASAPPVEPTPAPPVVEPPPPPAAPAQDPNPAPQSAPAGTNGGCAGCATAGYPAPSDVAPFALAIASLAFGRRRSRIRNRATRG
jgi:MYXO-CTERM domain-containing protein